MISALRLAHTDWSFEVVLGGVMFFSVVWYYFPKYGGVHWFEGPVPTVEKTVGQVVEGSDRPSTSDSLEKEKNAAVMVSQRDAQ